MNNLERRPDNGNFDKLAADFSLLGQALEMLAQVECFESDNAKVKQIQKDSQYGVLVFSEVMREGVVEHNALLVDENNLERGFGFENGEISHIYGYSPYVSNQEIERFLTGFVEEIRKDDLA